MAKKQKKKQEKKPFKYIVNNYTVKGGCDEESGAKFNEGPIHGGDTVEELEQFIWDEVKRLADDDYEQYIGVNDDEEFGRIDRVFKDDYDNDITVAQFKEREGIKELKLMSYRVDAWNSMSDVEVYEIIPNPAYEAATECEGTIAQVDELLQKHNDAVEEYARELQDTSDIYNYAYELAELAKKLAKQLADRK